MDTRVYRIADSIILYYNLPPPKPPVSCLLVTELLKDRRLFMFGPEVLGLEANPGTEEDREG